MPSEQAFLLDIEAAPSDRSARLVYADWLEEKGDQRAELIRIEEEMRPLPSHADRYWELKPRRNVLRKESDSEWLRRMRYGEDHEPLSKEVPEGWRERWRLLREFTERWYGLPMADVGGNLEEIRKTEARLKRQLPPAMREWIAFCFDLGQNFVYVLRDGYEFVELEDLSSVSVMVAGEGDMYWAVKNANLHADDPEVDLYRLDYDENAGSFVHDSLFAPRLTSFVFRHMVTYLSACVPDGGKLVSYNDNTSARLFLRYLTDVFLGADHPLPGPY